MSDGLKKMQVELSIPVPYDVFVAATAAYERAARGDDPADHLPGGPKPGERADGYYLANIPMNRGMMAVMRATHGLPDNLRKGLGFRVMHFGEALEAAQSDPRFALHVVASDTEGAVNVSDAFMRALAECRFNVSEEKVEPDMEDAFHLAERYRLESEANS